jgi:hypothetical protein
MPSLKYPASVKMTDAGVLRDYKIEVAINNQHPKQLISWKLGK